MGSPRTYVNIGNAFLSLLQMMRSISLATTMALICWAWLTWYVLCHVFLLTLSSCFCIRFRNEEIEVVLYGLPSYLNQTFFSFKLHWCRNYETSRLRMWRSVSSFYSLFNSGLSTICAILCCCYPLEWCCCCFLGDWTSDGSSCKAEAPFFLLCFSIPLLCTLPAI